MITRTLSVLLPTLILIDSSHADLVAYWSANDGGGTTLTNTQGNSSLDGVLRLDAAWTANGSGHFGQAGDFALDLTGIATSGVDVFGLTTSFTEVTITA